MTNQTTIALLSKKHNLPEEFVQHLHNDVDFSKYQNLEFEQVVLLLFDGWKLHPEVDQTSMIVPVRKGEIALGDLLYLRDINYGLEGGLSLKEYGRKSGEEVVVIEIDQKTRPDMTLYGVRLTKDIRVNFFVVEEELGKKIKVED